MHTNLTYSTPNEFRTYIAEAPDAEIIGLVRYYVNRPSNEPVAEFLNPLTDEMLVRKLTY